MKNILILAALFAATFASAQTKSVLKNINGGTITESLTIGSGKTLTIASGATINATGATITGFTAAAAWGGITGTLSAQTDLQSALDLKLAIATASSTYQPLDADLTSIAGLSKTGNTLKVVRVNAGETAYELATLTSGVESITGTAGQITVTGTTTPTLSLPATITGPTIVQLGATGVVGQVIAPSTSSLGLQLRAYNGIDFFNTQYGYSMGSVNAGSWFIANVTCSAATKSTRMDLNYGFQAASAATLGWVSSSNTQLAPDTALSRISAGVVGVGTGAAGASNASLAALNLSLSGSLTVGSAGTATATVKHGAATLVAGTVTVSDSDILTTSRIFINRQTDGGTLGDSYSITRSAGVSFTITSKTANATATGDTSTVSYLIVNP